VPTKFRLDPRPFLFLAYLYNGYHAFRGSVDLPFLDEWDCWWTWEPGKVFDWIFLRHNEHRIVFTKLEFLLVNFLAGGNEIFLNAINYLLFGALLAVLCDRLVFITKNRWPLWFVLFLLSSLPYENHVWGFQSQIHFSLIFFFLAVPFLFRAGRKSQSIGVTLLIASIYSFGAGIALSFSVLLVYAGYRFFRRDDFLFCLLLFAVGLGFVFLWRIGFESPTGHSLHFYPWNGHFWVFFFTLVGNGFGLAKPVGIYWGAFWLSVCIFCWFISGLKYARQNCPEWWAGAASVVGIIAALAAITSGRADFDISVAKSSRYTEISLMLIPLTAAGLSLVLGERLEKQSWWLAGFVFYLLLVIVFARKFSANPYIDEWKRRAEGQKCVKSFYDGTGNGFCKQIYPGSLSDKLRRLELDHPSFIDSMNGIR
jgi:hypothetical protein